MAWRPYENLMSGELDNTELGKVVGWMKFNGLRSKVKFDLKGDFHRDIRGSKIKLTGEGVNREVGNHKNYMSGFSTVQTGSVGDITAGLPTGKDLEKGVDTYEYTSYPYIEWYSDKNGRCVLELDHSQIEIVTRPIPVIESDPIDRNKQEENMNIFMESMVKALKKTKGKI
jgi:hypothetical protein